VRSLKDLPAVGAAVSLRVHVTRWRCRRPTCAVRFFTGLLPGVATARGRRTCRADVVTHLVGHALGGRPGERLIHRLGLRVSDDTILRWLKSRTRGAITGARVIGIDEWAKRKGLTYGTIVVDLERRTVIDVLDTHTTGRVEAWLTAHPEIHTICRDRNGRYAKAARTSAPAAIQVADRFHLVQNLRDTIERELSMQRAHLRVALDGAGPSSSSAPSLDLEGTPVCVSGNPRERRLLPARRLAIDTEIARQRRQDEQALFDRFKGLQATRRPISAIAQQLGVNRRRLDRWGKVRALPTRRLMPPRPGSVETFRAYLRQRWDAGYRNGRMLFEEIRTLGYGGRYAALHKVMSPWRLGNVTFERDAELSSAGPLPAPAPTISPLPMNVPARQIAPQIAAALLAKPRTELSGRQGEIVDGLKAHCPGYAVMRSLMLAFR
jgi:hypothetical protein